MLFKAGKSYPPFFFVCGRSRDAYLVSRHGTTDPPEPLLLVPLTPTKLATVPYIRFHPLAYFMERQWDFFVYDTLYAILLYVTGEIPIWFGTTLSVASVISLNKTQFITHSRVFSLWSSFPFRPLLPYVIFKLIL